jgi:hypothetical protein
LTQKTINLLIRLGIEIAEWASVILRDKKKGNQTGKNRDTNKNPGTQHKKS